MFDKRESLKVKGIAICMLLFHHLFYSAQRIAANGVNFLFLSQDSVMSFAKGLRVCVWIFAFISAYGITVQYMALGDEANSKECMAFMKKRWLSMMKPYWLIFTMVVVISLLLSHNPLDLFKGSKRAMLLSVFAVSDYFAAPMPVAAWWYMCFAQIVLLLVPFLAQLCKKYGILVLVGAFILVPFMNAGIESKFGGSYINYLFVIIMGVLCAQNSTMEKLGVKSKHWYIRVLDFLLLIALIVGFVGINMKFGADDPYKVTKMFMGAAAVLICLLVYKYFTFSLLECVIIFLGKHSGNIFLIHAFGYTYFPKWIYWSHNVPMTFLTLLVLSLALSVACQALMNLGKSVMKRRKIQHTAA